MIWQVSAAMNLVIALAYFAICGTVLRGLIATKQLRENPLALATATIFFTCAVHHGSHTVHMLAPLFGADTAHGLAMRNAFSWQTDAWDVFGAVVGVYYLTLRRSYGTLLRTPGMFRDEVQAAASEQIERERALLADAEELASAGSSDYEIATAQIQWSAGMYRIRGIAPDVELTVALADSIDPRDRERVERISAEALASDVSTLELTYRIVRPDGSVRWLETRNRIDRDENGTAMRMRGVSIDVTGRRESERLREDAVRRLRERERLLRSVIDNDKAMIYVKDLEGRYLLYNSRFAEAFALEDRAAAEGVPATEVLLGRDDRWLDPALAPIWRANDLRAQTESYELEEYSDHPQRGRLTYDSIKFPLTTDDGSVYATCGVSLDTTERSRERQELATSARYFELSRDMVCSAGLDGVFQQLNQRWTETLGWSEDELRSRPFVEFVHPDDRERTERETAGLAQGGLTVDFVNRYATKDGNWRWLDWRAMAVVEDEVIYASARDVTENKAAEADLEASERRTRQIVETAHDAFVAIDANGLVTDWNPRAAEMFGWSREEAVGQTLAEMIIPVEHREAHLRGLRRFVAGAESAVLGRLLELHAVDRAGREFMVELTISPVASERGYSFNAFLRDITERRRVQEELALARDQALEASRMKSMFVANVSHEIRTPMNGVIGMSELLLDTKLDDEQREWAEMISSSGDALLDVVDDILDFSKIEAGKLELDATDFDLRDAIEKVCGLQADRAQRKGLELVVSVDANLPALLHGDAARISQVVSNFLSNAIKFTVAGEVLVHASATGGDARATSVRIEVCDSGVGIERDSLEQLFQPFSQADSSTTRRYGGTGLGLAISKQLMELMGGSVGAESERGTGSRFWLEVVLEHPAGTRLARLPKRAFPGVSVLVVDDNATSRRVLEQLLVAWKMRCEVAQDAATATKLLSAAAAAGKPFALALIDWNMPDVDGYELARAVRAQPALNDTRLVLLGPKGGGLASSQQRATFDKLLSKPVRQSRLFEELQAVLTGGPNDAHHRRTAAASGPESADPVPGPEVLVVEDTPVNQAVAVRMLEKCGFRASVADDGRKALVALAERQFAAVLMDCQMPELDGYETTREIRRGENGGRHVPVIAMTANSMRGERERCLEAGMDDYLTKPLRNQTLKDALRRWISESPEKPGGQSVKVDTATDADAVGRPLLDGALLAELGFDADALSGLFSMFLEQAEGQVSELRRTISEGESLVVAQTAHKLKGSSSAVGAAQLSYVAAELETCAKAQSLDRAPQLLEDLRCALDETRGAVAQRLNGAAQMAGQADPA